MTEPTREEESIARELSEVIKEDCEKGQEDACKFIRASLNHTKEIWRVVGAIFEAIDKYGEKVPAREFDLIFRKWGLPLGFDIEMSLLREFKAKKKKKLRDEIL